MDNASIAKLSDLEAHYLEQTTALLVDSFYDMFKGISKEREVLCKLFIACIRPELVYLLLQGNQIAGLIAVSDCNNRVIMIREDICISMFGSIKGKMMAWQLRKILSEPAVKEQKQGYIDFIATAPDFKRRGVATQLLTYVEQNTDFNCLYLDVLASNHAAICLYEKLGYIVHAVKKSVGMRLAGIKAMHIMKKELKQ